MLILKYEPLHYALYINRVYVFIRALNDYLTFRDVRIAFIDRVKSVSVMKIEVLESFYSRRREA